MHLAYLYSRYPVVSQTFCDMEMLELERRGYELLIGSVHPPLTSLRHEHFSRFRSPVYYAPPSPVLQLWEKKMRDAGKWPRALIERHESRYGPAYKAALRARNASYFADLFSRHAVRHFHVHFANRAAHTALFLKEMSGIPFSITAHGQDFMSDLGQDELLREICLAAEFVAVETDYSRDLLSKRCPEAAGKIHRVYNGIDLANLPFPWHGDRPSGPATILSVGRLVPFKGFEVLLEACAELERRNFDFRCQIVGDGPLREKLEATVARLKLQQRIELCGSLSQDEVYAKIRACDIFALASVLDAKGASDVFPTVIMEAMACAKPVVSSRLAGIPESVVDGLTGLLVPPNDWEELAQALDKLIRDPKLRARMGAAGRHRMETDFSVTRTIEPLNELFVDCLSETATKADPAKQAGGAQRAAYLIDRWPDENLPFLDTELKALERNGVAPVCFILRPPATDADITPAMADLVSSIEYLPDAMVVEAEWLAQLPLARELEAMRANQKHRSPSDLFLEQARAALTLRRLLQRHEITHAHATSSRSLLCALFLKKLLGITISATIEARPILNEHVIMQALDECVGGRSNDRELLTQRGSGFLFDRTRKSRMDWIGGRNFWREWSQQLNGWTRRT